MRRLCVVLKHGDVGAIGIGAMIVFIAMVLVAGIAASVLVQTANKLEIQAMETGEQTTAEVATGLRICDIEGHKSARSMPYNNTTGMWWNLSRDDGLNLSYYRHWHNWTRIHNMTLTVAPRAGSQDIDLAETIIEISNSTKKCVLNYTSNTNRDFAAAVATGGVFATTDVSSLFDQLPNGFGIIELEDADSSCGATMPVINRGDRVMLTINCSAIFWGLSERTDVWGMVIPEDGAPAVFAFRTPASYAADTVYDLY